MRTDTFLTFCKELQGYTFHSKKTGQQVYRWELYHSGYSVSDCFRKFESKKIPYTNYSFN